MKQFIVFISYFISFITNGQTFDRWAQVVNWDGISHWSRYLITQPAFQGPNALPVPLIGTGSIDTTTYIGISGNLHFSSGDNTQNFRLFTNYCLAKNLVAIDIAWIPIEHYTLSNAIKEKRHVFSEFYNDKLTRGDVYLNTNIQIMNKWRKYIQLGIRIGFRFPSGGGFGAARYIDAPGYYFDLSYGKNLNNESLKWIGMLGFYVWQIESDRFNQNDAFLFGNGIEWTKNNLKLQASINGYLGWMDGRGDKPIVFRTNFQKRFKKISLIGGFQQGLHDFNYSSFEFGMQYNFVKSLK